jgi:subtilisin family serine protease
MSPGTAFNVITVGNFDDKNSVAWSGDTMNVCSSWRDPTSTNGDREKPEMSAPGTNINTTHTASPWIGANVTGTSFSSPIVAAAAALLIDRNSTLGSWPEAVKAILMATAVHNIEGSARLSEFDGVGGLVAQYADDVARRVNGNWAGRSYTCTTANPLNATTMALTAGRRTRVVIVWDNDPAYASYATRPSADLDLSIRNPAGSVVASSVSYDNTYEIVDFTPSTSGTYTLRITRPRCSLSPRYLGWAWFRL